MKKFLVLAILVLGVAMFANATPPTVHSYGIVPHIIDTIKSTYQYGGTWKKVDSLVIVADQAASLTMSMGGILVMDPGQTAYLAFARAAGAATKLDTLKIIAPTVRAGIGPVYVPFSLPYYKTMTAVTDTVFVVACTNTAPTTGRLQQFFINRLAFNALVANP